jgi:hypothetical protein
MSFLAQIKALVAPPEPAGGPRIAVFGDSHSAALLRAQEFADRYDHIQVFRLRKEKDGRSIGDAELSSFCREIRRFSAEDYIFSAVGGNQYAVISTVRDPIEYDFLVSPADDHIRRDRTALIPFRAIAGYIECGVRGSIGPVLREIRRSTDAKLFHLAPPPPKQDNSFITAHFETRFAKDGLQDFGPTHPELRLKCWKVQLDCLTALCEELQIDLVMPPAKGLTPEGYLAPRCYAKDVTHANRRYGEFVLRQISKLTGTLDQVRLSAR